MEERKSFHVADYVIFVATLIVSMTIGLYFGLCKKRDFSSVDYFFGGKKLSALPVALSFIVTYQSSLMILGFPADTYGYGLKQSLALFGIALSFILGSLIAVPVLRPLNITSVFKYFSLRYGSNEVRFIAAAGGIIYYIFYMAAVVLGTCVALNSVLRVPFWATVITYVIVTTIYTSLGGFKAVIWTDVFQLVVMLTGIIATLIKSVAEVGGPSKVHALAEDRFDIVDFRMDPTLRYTVWITFFGSITPYMYLFFTQAGLQRIKSTHDTKGTYVMCAIAAPLYCLFFSLCFFEGVTIFAYYASIGCDPLASGRISNINEVVPTAVMDLFGSMPGFPGLFIASLSSAALSTLSSCLTALSSMTFEDIIKIKYPEISDKKATKWSKVVVFLYGILTIGMCYLMSFVSGPVTAIAQAFASSIDGPILGIFILSIFFLRSTTKGIIIGMVSGMVLSMTLNVGQSFITIPSSAYLPLGPIDGCLAANFTDNVTDKTNYSATPVFLSTVTQGTLNLTTECGTLYADDVTLLQKIFGISYYLFSIFGFLITVIVGTIGSLLTRPTPRKDIDMATLYALPDWFCSLFPNCFFYSKSSEKERTLLREEERKILNEDTIELMKQEQKQITQLRA